MRIVLTALLFISAVFAQVSSIPAATGTGGGGTGNMTVTSVTADPSAACTVGSDWRVRTDLTPKTIWFCDTASGTWQKMLSTLNSGVFSTTGLTGTIPASPASTYVTEFFDSTALMPQAVDSSGNRNSMVRTAGARVANQYVTHIDATGIAIKAQPVYADLLSVPSLAISSGAPAIPGGTYKVAFVSNAASGNVDLYTAPAGTRGVLGGITCYNTAGTTTTYIPYWKKGGTYYRLNAASTASTLASTTITIAPVIDSGDSASINFSQTGSNCEVSVYEFPNTVSYYSAAITSFTAATYNTVYTVPASTVALSPTSQGIYATDTSRNISWYFVPSGQTAGSAYQVTPTVAVSANTASATTPFKAGAAGDSLAVYVDTNTGAAIAYVTVMEIPQ